MKKLHFLQLIIYVFIFSSCQESQNEKPIKKEIKTMEDLNAIVETSRDLEFSYEFQNKKNGVKFIFELYSGGPDPENKIEEIQYTGIYRNDKNISQAIEKSENKFIVSMNDYIDYFLIEENDKVSFFHNEKKLSDEGFEVTRKK